MRITLTKLAAVVAIFCLPCICLAADDFDNLLNDIGSVQKAAAGPEVKKAMEECDALARAVTESEKNEKEAVKNIGDMKFKYTGSLNLRDPWGGEYMLDTKKYKVYSKGPDGKEGTADDIQATYTSTVPGGSAEKQSDDDAQKTKAGQDCDMIAIAVKKYNSLEGEIVTDLMDLKEKYITNIDTLKDPWGNAYALGLKKSIIFSKGPDGKEGTADDIQVSYALSKPVEPDDKSKPRVDLIKKSCWSNMKTLEGAVELYNMESPTPSETMTLTTKELKEKGYLKQVPYCPAAPEKQYSIEYKKTSGSGNYQTDVKCEVHGTLKDFEINN